MTREQKALLRRHAEHYETMMSFVRESSDDELAELMDACLAAGVANCAWSIYEAAQYLKRETQTELTVRARRQQQAALTETTAKRMEEP